MSDPDYIEHPLDLLIGYEPGMPLPGPDPRRPQWNPEDAYIKRRTEDAHWYWVFRAALGNRWRSLSIKTLRGITNRKYLDLGRRLVRALIEQGIIDMSDVAERDAARVEDALGYCAGLVKDENADHKHRLAAAAKVLEFLKTKPVTKVENTIKTAEDFLDAIEE